MSRNCSFFVSAKQQCHDHVSAANDVIAKIEIQIVSREASRIMIKDTEWDGAIEPHPS